MAPKDGSELGRMLRGALELDGPAVIRYPRGAVPGVPVEEDPRPLPVGTWEELRPGRDMVFLAVGACVVPAVEAARMLEEQGWRAGVVNARFIKPLDGELLESLAGETDLLLTAEENVLAGGFGSAVLEHLSSAGIGHPRVERAGIPDQFVEHGSQAVLRSKFGLDAAGLYQRALRALEGKARRASGQEKTRSRKG
jgi:1-deoxy-D-xylulose-5-phosphate synthase